MNNQSSISKRTRRLCLAAVFMAFNIVLSSVSIPVPGGHLYMNDVIIVAASILLDPLSAFLVGGVGAFLGDFYCSHNIFQKNKICASGIGALLGAVIMVIGYTLGRAYVYSTPEYAVIKLPFEILQAGVGVVFGMILVWKAGLKNIIRQILKEEP